MIETFKAKQLNKLNGDFGEKMAREFLEQQGYKIIETKYKTKLGEIDIIARKNNITIFVEVKYKHNVNFGYPRQMVNVYKQNKIRKVAELYCVRNKLLNTQLRFDVLEIIDKTITHIENAF